jgi:phage terminase large subunit
VSLAEAAAKIKRWRDKPILFFTEELHLTPDAWQEEALVALEDPDLKRLSLQACAGPGKSLMEAAIGWWFLGTHGDIGDHPQGAAVSISSDNLKDNLWPKFSQLRERSNYLKFAFTWTNERVFANDHPATWFISARAWAKKASIDEQADTLSGLHSGYVLALIDESGGIPLAVANRAEQALSTNPKFGLIVQAGNPVSRAGMLYTAATTLRHLWKVIRITGDPDDPKRSSRIDIGWARQQIATFGRDNPWVKAYILGEFPPSAINVLLGPEEVEAAMERNIKSAEYANQQRRLGIDVAREGDDRTVIFPRQGLRAFVPVEMRNQNGPQVAARIAVAKEKWDWEVCFVDDSGGFGGSVQDAMMSGGLSPVPVNFSGRADDPRYANKRAEMWFRMAAWVQRGGALPKNSQLVRELTTSKYTFDSKGRFLVIPKDMVKKDLGFSPDLADALALTFAWPEMPTETVDGVSIAPRTRLRSEFDPFKQTETPRKDRLEEALEMTQGLMGR